MNKAQGHITVHRRPRDGQDGANGKDGQDGKPGKDGNGIERVETAYAVGDNGTTPPEGGWQGTIPEVPPGKWLWKRTTTHFTNGKSETEYLCSRQGQDGAPGKDGEPGKDGNAGPAIVYRGEWDATKTYYGNDKRVDVVKYRKSGADWYYIAKPTAGTIRGIIPTNTDKWDEFGASFDSIATGLLLAEEANIGGWVIRNNRLEAQDDPGTYLQGKDGAIQTGRLVAKDGCKIGRFTIDNGGIVNLDNANVYIALRDDSYGRFAGIGVNMTPQTGYRWDAVGKFVNEDTRDGWGLKRNTALVISAKNGRYNHAFLGSGNGNLDGWIGGYKYSKFELEKDNIIYSSFANLRDNNRWIIYSSGTASGVSLPRLIEVRDALDIDDGTRFCVEFTFLADLNTKPFSVWGRTKREFPTGSFLDTDQYPDIITWNNGYWEKVDMEAGDSLTVWLIYDHGNGSIIDGHKAIYTARIINRQN